jgi:formate hydrogenlyase subunit 3/multisubunit Na+/H+ antiporter MnhD subunit
VIQRRLCTLAIALFLTGLATLLSEQDSLACSVCAADPDSAMGQGVQAGVIVLLAVIGAVLAGLASLLGFWIRRAHRLSDPQLESQ